MILTSIVDCGREYLEGTRHRFPELIHPANEGVIKLVMGVGWGKGIDVEKVGNHSNEVHYDGSLAAVESR